MPGSSTNTSFIPKQSPSKQKRRAPKRKLMAITIVAYVLLLSSLLAAAGVYGYAEYTNNLLEQEVLLLDQEVNTFSVKDFARVQEFETILEKATGRIENTPSIVAILDKIDGATAEPIQIERLEMERVADENIAVELAFKTETLDAALFQRKLLAFMDEEFVNPAVEEINLGQSVSEDGEINTAGLEVSFAMTFTVPLQSVAFDPAEVRRPDAGEFVAGQANGLSTTIQNQSQTSSFGEESDDGGSQEEGDELSDSNQAGV